MSHERQTTAARVSVVVVTRDRRPALLACLARLAQMPDALEVIVVDNASSDGSADAVARGFPWVRLLVLEEDLGPAARNAGVRASHAPYVAFADEDSGWEPGALDHAAAVLDEHTGVGLIAAALYVGPERMPDASNERLKDSPLGTEPGLPGTQVLSFHASAAIVRKEAFLEADGFERHCTVGGEELLALDLSSFGWKLIYLESVHAYRLPSEGWDAARERRLVRDALWTTWLRRRGAGIALGTRAALRRGAQRWQGALLALGGLPWVMRQRRRLPPRVELDRRRLERPEPWRHAAQHDKNAE